MKSHKVIGKTTLVKRDPPHYHMKDEAVIVGEAVKFTCSTKGPDIMTVYVTFRNPRVFSVWMRVPGTAHDTRDTFVSSADEHFFGLGEIWNARSLDLKGHKLVMDNGGPGPEQGGHVPFYVSTRGYGILVDNYLPVGFDFSSSESAVISSPKIIGSYGPDEKGYVKGSSMLWYFYYGPDLLDVIDRFTEHVSRSALPPPWAVFTPWTNGWTSSTAGSSNTAIKTRTTLAP